MTAPDPLLDRAAIWEAFTRLGERLARCGVVAKDSSLVKDDDSRPG
jgi:hypothetical protein